MSWNLHSISSPSGSVSLISNASAVLQGSSGSRYNLRLVSGPWAVALVRYCWSWVLLMKCPSLLSFYFQYHAKSLFFIEAKTCFLSLKEWKVSVLNIFYTRPCFSFLSWKSLWEKTGRFLSHKTKHSIHSVLSPTLWLNKFSCMRRVILASAEARRVISFLNGDMATSDTRTHREKGRERKRARDPFYIKYKPNMHYNTFHLT